MDLKNKRILVTGADGFIGSHLAERLVAKGAKVKAFVFYNAFNRWGWIDSFPEPIKKKIEVFCGDMRDPNGVLEAVKGADVVFHLAALIGIPFSYHSPDSYVDTNIKGTLNVLQAARKCKVKKIIHTSTSEVYGTAQYIPIDEKHPINPQSPYAATKAAADSLALSFYRSFDLPVTIIRPFNTFGPRQSARAIMPTIITQILSGKKTIELGSLETTRDFNYVDNVVDGFVRIAEEKKTEGEVFNIGSGREISIGELVNVIAGVLKKDIKTKKERKRVRPSKSEVRRLLCDSDKAQKTCGWRNTVSLEQGLRKTCAWMKGNLYQYKPEIYNV